MRERRGAWHADSDSPWTPQRIQRLQELWPQGYTAASIAGLIGGVNRNQVLGKVHRLGLPPRETDRPGLGAGPRPVRFARFTAAQDALIRELWPTGMSTRDMAERVGCRNPASVSYRATKLGLERRRSTLRFWTEAEQATLRTAAAAGESAPAIAEKLGRSVKAVYRTATRLEIAIRDSRGGRQHWSPADTARFRAMAAAGHGAAAIGQALGRSAHAIRLHARSLGIGLRDQRFGNGRPAHNRRASILTRTGPVEIALAPDPDCRTPLLALRPRDCRWPGGDPRAPGFGFCGAPAKPGSAYCTHHHARAYSGRWRGADDSGERAA